MKLGFVSGSKVSRYYTNPPLNVNLFNVSGELKVKPWHYLGIFQYLPHKRLNVTYSTTKLFKCLQREWTGHKVLGSFPSRSRRSRSGGYRDNCVPTCWLLLEAEYTSPNKVNLFDYGGIMCINPKRLKVTYSAAKFYFL